VTGPVSSQTAQRFITFEGGEGAGKTTQVQSLADAMRHAGLDVITTREPGGSPAAEAVRRVLIDPEHDWAPLSEALLHAAARNEHLRQTVRPALDRGAWVLSDRFADSTRAYQGYGQGLSMDVVDQLNSLVVDATWPVLTIILDVPVDEGLRRAHGRGEGRDRYEAMDHALHERLRQGFLDMAAAEPDRCVVIDAARDPESVQADIRATARERLGLSV
jgi:dTMP kinase